jgi:type IV fimbrial biogenesis protein FimT
MISRRPNCAGFTLTELMIAVAVLATLMALGLPSFRQMLRNYEVRAAAESVANGLQRARAEAVAHNASVYFKLTGGTSWTVNYVTAPVTPALDSRSSSEGSPNVVLAATPSTATTVTYNNLGQALATNADSSVPPTQIDFNATAAGANQTLRVLIGVGGGARVCDPSLPSGNARAC